MKIPKDLLVVMPGHSYPKDGVLSHAYAPVIHVLDGLLHARRRCRT
jgi:hypothetical protein